jgi:hypothetical protein
VIGEVVSFDATVSLSLIFAVLSAVFAWWRTREAASAKEIAELKHDVSELDKRLSQAERDLTLMPGTNELNKLTLALSEIRGDLKAMNAVMKGQGQIMERIELSVSRHEDHLRTHG